MCMMHCPLCEMTYFTPLCQQFMNRLWNLNCGNERWLCWENTLTTDCCRVSLSVLVAHLSNLIWFCRSSWSARDSEQVMRGKVKSLMCEGTGFRCISLKDIWYITFLILKCIMQSVTNMVLTISCLTIFCDLDMQSQNENCWRICVFCCSGQNKCDIMGFPEDILVSEIL